MSEIYIDIIPLEVGESHIERLGPFSSWEAAVETNDRIITNLNDDVYDTMIFSLWFWL